MSLILECKNEPLSEVQRSHYDSVKNALGFLMSTLSDDKPVETHRSTRSKSPIRESNNSKKTKKNENDGDSSASAGDKNKSTNITSSKTSGTPPVAKRNFTQKQREMARWRANNRQRVNGRFLSRAAVSASRSQSRPTLSRKPAAAAAGEDVPDSPSAASRPADVAVNLESILFDRLSCVSVRNDALCSANWSCVECRRRINSSGTHFRGVFSCRLCRYISCCEAGCRQHHLQYHSAESRWSPDDNISQTSLLPAPMWCLCGFRSDCPSQLAAHMVVCGQYSVYPGRKQNRIDHRWGIDGW